MTYKPLMCKRWDTSDSRSDVTQVCYDLGKLTVTVESSQENKSYQASFAEICGFRLLDEGDLLEFWPACADSEHWVFQIEEGGWYAQESLRPGFLRKDIAAIQEFLITSSNGCVSVLAWEEPEIKSC
ncbi:hypothetical protein [Undibacterium sp. KW1]|uniref:hypothetical protein n=1 Tax=Undibacterium sp. KW1 TaxID=2058624 RepID=UPI001389BEA8|nr:hypothetical protein [Undibacterium sp. KW1]